MSNTTNAIDLDETHLESSTMEGDDFQQKAASFLMYKIGKLSVCIAIKRYLILTRQGLFCWFRPKYFRGLGEPTKTKRAGLDLAQLIAKEKWWPSNSNILKANV